MTKVICENIKWDTESNGIQYSPVELNLPTSVILNAEDVYEDEEEMNDDEDMGYEIVCDYLSDHYGWCIYSFDAHIEKAEEQED